MSNRNLTPAEIQKILEEQRATAEIYKKSDFQINVTLGNRNKAEDPTWRENIKKSNLKKSQDPAWREKVKTANNNWSEERKQAYQNRDRSYIDSEWRDKIAEKNRSRNSTPEFIEKVKSGLKKYVEENSDHIKEKNRITNTNPDHIANRKKGIKDFFNSPEGLLERQKRGARFSKPIHTPEGDFPSLTAAAEHYSILRNNRNGRKHVMSMMKREPNLYYFLNKESKKSTNGKPIHTPEGDFPSLAAAADYYNTLRNFNNGGKYLRSKMKLEPDDYYFI